MLRGRAGDVRAVRSHLDDSSAVVVVGDAGIGKTALLHVLAGSVERAVLTCAYATLRWQPLFPFASILGETLRDDDAVSLATRVRREVGTGALMFDDAHWADDLTMRVLPLLVGQLRLVVAVRSGSADADAVTAALQGAGAAVHKLKRLAPKEAEEVVRDVRPGLGPRAIAEITRRAGGNPLLLSELARSDVPSPTLRRRVEAGLRALTPPSLGDLELLAVVGHPVPQEVMRASASELVAASLVTVDGDRAAICHPLLGELCLALTPPDRRARAHARAAGLALPAAERALHWVEAGAPEAAFRIARAAATHARTPTEHASLLAMAARCAPAESAAAVRMAAAEAAVAAGLEAQADRILSEIQPDGPMERFRLRILESQTAWAVGDDDRSLAAVEQAEQVIASERVPGLDEVEAHLAVLLGRARHALLAAGEVDRANEMANQAVETARTHHSPQLARAMYLLGSGLSMAGQQGYQDCLTESIRLARDIGDHDLELRAGNNLVASHELAGDHEAGRAVARTMARRADELGLGAHVAQFRAAVANLDVLDGWVEGSLTACDELLAGVVEPRTRDQLEVSRTIALLDLGRFEEARAQITTSLHTAAADPFGRAQFAYLEAEAELMLGRPEACLSLLHGLEGLPRAGELRAFGRLTSLRALAALGRTESDGGEEWPSVRFFEGAPLEMQAHALRLAGRHGDAAALFDTAASLWRPHYLRSALYCDWQAGLALLAEGDAATAIAALESAERLADEHGMTWQLAQLRQSLRAAGVRRSFPVTQTPTGLTSRESQVLQLAADGVTNAEIAARLGLSRRTVETQLASATAKLRVASRGAAGARIERL